MFVQDIYLNGEQFDDIKEKNYILKKWKALN